MRRSIYTMVVIAGLALLAGPNVAPAQTIVLRVHYYLPAAAPVPRDFIVPWGKKVEAESKGRIKVEHYPSMQLGGSPPQLFDQVKDGVADIVLTMPGMTPGRFPRSEALELPFIASNGEQSSQAAWEFYEKHLKGEFKDVHIIAAHTHSAGLIHAKGKGVHRLEDMKGIKLRGPSRLVNKLLDTLGATPVGLPMPAIPDALSKGVIDGAVVPWEVTTPLRLGELVNTHTTFAGNRSLYVAFLILAMNKAKYESLPADLKEVIDRNSGIEVSRWVGNVMDAADLPAIEAARKRGNTVLTLDEAETLRWKGAASKVADGWITEMKNRNIDGQALIRDAELLMSKYAGAVSAKAAP